MRLPGTEQWSAEGIAAQIAFEMEFANAAPSLLEVTDAVSNKNEPVRSSPRTVFESIFALGRAAEIAFATEDVARGATICSQILRTQHPKTPMQTAFYAAVGGVIGVIRVHFSPGGIFLYGPLEQRIELQWP